MEVLRDGDPGALYYRRGWTDGLPIVPPTLDRVDAMLRAGGRGRNESLGELDPLKGVATVERVAANAVMAGCAPEHFPVVVAAVEALADPAFNLRGVQTTDENVAPLILLSGPVVERLEVNAGFGMLGPGWQANAAIGRAVRFVMNNIGGGWPEAVSFAGLGQPGRYTMVLAENAAANPWEPLHEELGRENALVLMRAETAINVTGGLDDLASVMGSAASAFNMAWEGKAAVVMAPVRRAGTGRAGPVQGGREGGALAEGADAARRIREALAAHPPDRQQALAGMDGGRGRSAGRRAAGGYRADRSGRRHPDPAIAPGSPPGVFRPAAS